MQRLQQNKKSVAAKNPVKSSAKTPVKSSVKTPVKSSAKSPVKSQAKTVAKSNVKSVVKPPNQPVAVIPQTNPQIKNQQVIPIVAAQPSSYSTLETSYPITLMTHTLPPPPPIMYFPSQMPKDFSLISTTPKPMFYTQLPISTTTSVLKYPPTSLLSENYNVENMSYGNGTYIAVDGYNTGCQQLFNGVKTSTTLSGNTGSSDQYIRNFAVSRSYSTVTGFFQGSSQFNTVGFDGNTYRDYGGFFFELTMPLQIYLTDVFFYQANKNSQPLDVIVMGRINTSDDFHLIARATSLNYIESGNEACAKISIQPTASYDCIRIVVTRIGYLNNNGMYEGNPRELSLSEVEFYGRQ